MGAIVAEQETQVSFMRDSDVCQVYTTDPTVMTKLDKLAKSADAPEWKLVKEHKDIHGELVGKTYETNKRLISFRANRIARELTEEQREAAAERLKAWREKKGKNHEEG